MRRVNILDQICGSLSKAHGMGLRPSSKSAPAICT